jgi:hypothetical protein
VVSGIQGGIQGSGVGNGGRKKSAKSNEIMKKPQMAFGE